MAFRKFLRSKIHRAILTGADVSYEGSITVPPELMEAAALAEYESVHVWDVTNGARFETYVIQGMPGSTEICVNGAAARLVQPGDLVIIACFAFLTEAELPDFKPRVVFVDEHNRIREIRAESAARNVRGKEE